MPHTIQWSFDPSNPVIQPGQVNGELDAQLTACGQVVRIGDRYRLYYWGRGRDSVNRICIAESSIADPNDWKGLGSVLGPQEDTDYNCDGPVIPSVLPRDDGPWLMYLGTNGKPKVPGTFHWYSGLAASDDGGLTWEYLTRDPLIPPEAPYDCVGTGTLFTVLEAELYHCYYTCCSGYEEIPGHGLKSIVGIGYAISSDGIRWEKPYDDFLIAPRRDARQNHEWWVAKPMVIREGKNAWRMWASCYGERYRVFSLTSEDLIHWEWQPVDDDGDLGVGEEGAFDSLQRSYTAVILEGDEYRCWYSGNGYGATGIGYAVGSRT